MFVLVLVQLTPWTPLPRVMLMHKWVAIQSYMFASAIPEVPVEALTPRLTVPVVGRSLTVGPVISEAVSIAIYTDLVQMISLIGDKLCVQDDLKISNKIIILLDNSAQNIPPQCLAVFPFLFW